MCRKEVKHAAVRLSAASVDNGVSSPWLSVFVHTRLDFQQIWVSRSSHCPGQDTLVAWVDMVVPQRKGQCQALNLVAISWSLLRTYAWENVTPLSPETFLRFLQLSGLGLAAWQRKGRGHSSQKGLVLCFLRRLQENKVGVLIHSTPIRIWSSGAPAVKMLQRTKVILLAWRLAGPAPEYLPLNLKKCPGGFHKPGIHRVPPLSLSDPGEHDNSLEVAWGWGCASLARCISAGPKSQTLWGGGELSSGPVSILPFQGL